MPEQSPNLSLPLIMPAQAQKHVTHNEAIELLDAIVQLTLVTRDATVPPLSPSEGQAYALGTAPTDAWAGQDGMIACWRGGGWLFVSPVAGWRAWDSNDAAHLVFDGTGWVTVTNGNLGQLMHLDPASVPAAPAAGDVYFDSATLKLRCYDGTQWQDLF